MICLMYLLVFNASNTHISLCVKCDLSTFESKVILLSLRMVGLKKLILKFIAQTIRNWVFEHFSGLSFFLHLLKFCSHAIIFFIWFIFVPKIDPDSFKFGDVKVFDFALNISRLVGALSIVNSLWFPCLGKSKKQCYGFCQHILF